MHPPGGRAEAATSAARAVGTEEGRGDRGRRLGNQTACQFSSSRMQTHLPFILRSALRNLVVNIRGALLQMQSKQHCFGEKITV